VHFVEYIFLFALLSLLVAGWLAGCYMELFVIEPVR
jgi:hypothetical protein